MRKKYPHRTLKTVLITVFAVYLALLMTPFSFTGKAYGSETNENYFRSTYAENPALNNIHVSKIAMLGSHDSLSYGINLFSKPNSNEDNPVNNIFVRIFGKGISVRLAKAQKASVYNQLAHGVRYLDFRVTCIGGKYYSSHGLISEELSLPLNETLKFLSENAGELVLINFTHYYGGNSSFEEFSEFLAGVKYDGKNLFDYINYDVENKNDFSVTYGEVTANGEKAGVILISNENAGIYGKNYMPEKLYSVWHNKTTTEEIVGLLPETMENAKLYGDKFLKINQSQTTPKGEEPLKSFAMWSLLSYAEKHNNKMLNLDCFSDLIATMPVYMCDFSTSTYKDFNAEILSRLTAYNLNLR